MKPKLQSSCLRYCLLCSGACSNDKPTDKGCQQGDGGFFGGGPLVENGFNCESSLKQQLKNMFILLKLLDVPKNWCEGILRGDDDEETEEGIGGGTGNGNNPDSWFTLCAKCEDKVDKAWNAYRQMLKWANRLTTVKVQIKEQMRKGIAVGNCFKERFYSDDGIEVVNFEVGKLLFPDLFQEIKEEIEDEDEAISFMDDNEVDQMPPEGATMQHYLDQGSGTKGASLSVEENSGPEGAPRQTQIIGVGGGNDIKRRRGRPKNLNGPTSGARPTTPHLNGGLIRKRGRPKKLNLDKVEARQSENGQEGEGEAYQLNEKCLSVALERLNGNCPPKRQELGRGPLQNGSLFKKRQVGRPPIKKRSLLEKRKGGRHVGHGSPLKNGSPLRKGKVGRPRIKGSPLLGKGTVRRGRPLGSGSPMKKKGSLVKKRQVGRPRNKIKSPPLFISPRRRLRGRPRKKMVPLRLSS